MSFSGLATIFAASFGSVSANTKYSIGQQLALSFQPDDSSCLQISSNELISIMLMQVKKAELWERPLENIAGLFEKFGAVHQGVVVTLENGARYVIHKFARDNTGFGSSSRNAQDGHAENIEVNDDQESANVIVATATDMGKKWSRVKDKRIRHSTVDDFVKVCGNEYRLFSDNCIHAASRMMDLE